MLRFLVLSFAAVLCLSACDDKVENMSPQDINEKVQDEIVDKWVGQWNGPEATYLIIAKSGDGYNIRIKDLDAEKSYLGAASGPTITFHREDHQEKLYANTGKGTGMKWLEPYADCLMTKLGEGWCRDYKPAEQSKTTTPPVTKP